MSKKSVPCPVCGSYCSTKKEGENSYVVTCPRCSFSSMFRRSRTEKEAVEKFEELSELFIHVLQKLFYSNVRVIEIPTLDFLLDKTAKEIEDKGFADSKRYAQLASFIREVIGRGENGR